MRLLRSLAFGLLVAGGAYCVGFVACRLGHELYPYAGPVFDALLPGWVAVAMATGGFYGYRSRNPKLRSLVLAFTFIVTLTGFYTMAVQLIDEHHDTALREQRERWRTWARVMAKSAPKKNRCEWFLLQERLAMNGELAPNDAAFTRYYCSRWRRSIQSVHDPIDDIPPSEESVPSESRSMEVLRGAKRLSEEGRVAEAMAMCR